jgi:hypothetical protein
MSFRPIALFIGLSISLAGGLHRASAAESLTAGCQPSPSGLAHSGERWMYRKIRATGEKCWYRAGARRARPAEQIAVVASDEAQYDPAESSAGTCVAAPTGPAPRNTQWRYRIDLHTRQKCWGLTRVVARQAGASRTHASLSGRSREIEDDNLQALRSVSNVQARLLEPDDVGGSPAPVSHDDRPESAPAPAPTPTFDSRWTEPPEFNGTIDARIHQWEMAVPVPDGREQAGPDTATQTDQINAANTVRISGLLIATVASIAVATGLYAAINGSADSIGWMRGRASRSDNSDHRSSPQGGDTIADILDRLNREEGSAKRRALDFDGAGRGHE